MYDLLRDVYRELGTVHGRFQVGEQWVDWFVNPDKTEVRVVFKDPSLSEVRTVMLWLVDAGWPPRELARVDEDLVIGVARQEWVTRATVAALAHKLRMVTPE